MKTRKYIAISLIAAAAVCFPLYTGLYLHQVAITILIYMGLAISWDMLLRSGQLSFGIAGFFGLGAYTAVLLQLNAGVPPLFGIVIGGIVAMLVATLLGLAVLRLRGIYFAITTLALASIFQLMARNFPSFTGGVWGKILPSVIFGGDTAKAYWLALGAVALSIVLSEIFRHSRVHLALTSIRDNETVAKSSGVDVFRSLTFAFAVTSGIQGLLGGVYAQVYGFISPAESFNISFLLLPLAMALLGGVYSTAGPIVGALILGAAGEFLKLQIPYGHRLVYGAMIILVVLFMPRGVVGALRGLSRRKEAEATRPEPRPEARPKSPGKAGPVPGVSFEEEAILSTERLTKRFGGLVALDEVSIALSKGYILGIIGPNGAGKTTLVNVISGIHFPTGGRVIFEGRDVTHLPAHVRSRMGIARTFQLIHPLTDLNALENIMVAAVFSRGLGLKEARRKAEEVATFLGLAGLRRDVSQLTALEIKKLEIARALAASPKVLFLDEAMAGLNIEETEEMIGLVREIHAQGIALGVIEHVMGVIRELTHRVVVLDAGKVIAEGPYEEVVTNERVIKAYLGEEA